MLILATQRRQLSHAYAALVTVRWQDTVHTLVLQHHPAGPRRWQSRFYDTRELTTTTLPAWESATHEYPTDAIDALLEYLAPLGLPDDLIPLVNHLLPTSVIGAPPTLPD